MNQTQRNAAKKAMVDWLKHPAELGKAPAKIECAGEFDLYDMHYYIFKYKKGIFGKWMLGVAGGYEGDELENCGHTFSEMQLYQEATAEKDAIALVEYVRNYIMEQANRAEEKKQNTGTFVNFVLLKDAVWNKEAFLNNLKEGWGIEPEPQEDEEKEEEEVVIKDYTLAYNGGNIYEIENDGGFSVVFEVYDKQNKKTGDKKMYINEETVIKDGNSKIRLDSFITFIENQGGDIIFFDCEVRENDKVINSIKYSSEGFGEEEEEPEEEESPKEEEKKEEPAPEEPAPEEPEEEEPAPEEPSTEEPAEETAPVTE